MVCFVHSVFSRKITGPSFAALVCISLKKTLSFFVPSTTDSFSQSLWEWKPTRIRSKIFQWSGVSNLSSFPSYQQAKYLHCAERNEWNNEVKTRISEPGHTAETIANFSVHLQNETNLGWDLLEDGFLCFTLLWCITCNPRNTWRLQRGCIRTLISSPDEELKWGVKFSLGC